RAERDRPRGRLLVRQQPAGREHRRPHGGRRRRRGPPPPCAHLGHPAHARPAAPRRGPRRRAAVLDAFAATFGDAARTPTGYVEKDWTGDRWTKGCPTAHTPPGVLRRYCPALRRPPGRVHLSGNEES